jgi:hypothetical protein
MGLSFTIAAGPRQLSHSRVRVPRDSRPHFTFSDSRLPQPGGPGPYIYVPQEQGGPVISSLCNLGADPQKTPLPLLLRVDSLLQRCVYRTVA